MKKNNSRKRTVLIVIFFFLIVTVAGVSWAAVNSAKASALVLSTLLRASFPVETLQYGRVTGSLIAGLTAREVHIGLVSGESAFISELSLEPVRRWPLIIQLKGRGIALKTLSAGDCFADEARFEAGRLEAEGVHAGAVSWGGVEAAIALKSVTLDFSDAENLKAKIESVRLDSKEFGSAEAKSAFWESSGALRFSGIKIGRIRELPEAAVEIQGLSLDLNSAMKVMKIDNGQLRIGSSQPVLFYGSAESGEVDFRVFTKELELRDLLPIFSDHAIPRHLSGFLEDVDLEIRGTPQQPLISGSLYARKFSYRQFYLRDSAWKTEGLRFKIKKDAFAVSGRLSVEGGRLSRGDTVVTVEPGRLDFDENPMEPKMNLNGVSLIDKTKIRLSLRGSPEKPDFRLLSDPSYPEEKLVVMLATGRIWRGSEKAIEEGRLSLDAAKEFLDYFLLGGSGHRIASRLGIREMSLAVTEESESVRLKKEISKKVDLGYGVERKKIVEKEPSAVAQLVGLDYRVSRNTIVSVEGKIATKPTPSPEEVLEDKSAPATNKSVLVKVDRRF